MTIAINRPYFLERNQSGQKRIRICIRFTENTKKTVSKTLWKWRKCARFKALCPPLRAMPKCPLREFEECFPILRTPWQWRRRSWWWILEKYILSLHQNRTKWYYMWIYCNGGDGDLESIAQIKMTPWCKYSVELDSLSVLEITAIFLVDINYHQLYY